MKIHYLVTSLETGGAEFAIPDIVRTLQNLGHEVSIIACEPRDMGAAVRLTEAGMTWRLLANKRRSLPVILGAYMIRVRADRPDVIWTSLSWGTRIGQWAGRLTGIPVVSFKHSASVRRYTYRMRGMSRLWIGDSQTVVRFLRDEMHIPPEQVMAWPFFQSNPHAPQATGWDGKSVLQLASVGRLHEVKNYAGLIDALALFLNSHPQFASRIRLTILGDGPERQALQDKIDQHGLSDVVSLPGFSPEVADFLTRQHVYIQTSRYEGMCIAVHEAMNAALPVIATPVGELRDAVKNGETGYVLEGELSQALASTLERIFANPAELQQFGQQARRYVLSTFSPERYTRSATLVLDRLNDKLHYQTSSQ
ncbi:glycosyltransferase family 4 protein [Shimwellia pseudoproteus]|uniref:glycosyltransferase family 4 protein n=1 Tax=Shimwellia pseudoproteus TaxID=570012 RepID=UPI0018EA7475|nr:glycosyltransferase family 4 protein [Shimwellia pseudoproteus]MBJ3813639.1 glycosyltransferase family 4 protein [Shimwellia pseudoproteus]